MHTIILCLLLFNCTNTISKKEKNNVMDEPKKTIIMNNLDFKDIMKLEKKIAIKKYGKPLKEELLKPIDMPEEEALQKPKIISEKNITKLQSYRIK